MIDSKYHFEGRDKSGKPIIIDIADIGGRYEVMALRLNGSEIACGVYRDLTDAIHAYDNMKILYALREGEDAPLTGKYAKLRDDLNAALEAAKQAALDVDDGGTCNLDAAALSLPRWRKSLVEQAAKEAGTGCFSWQSFGGLRYVFTTPRVGQAHRNEVAAETMTSELSRRGYDAFCYQQMD